MFGSNVYNAVASTLLKTLEFIILNMVMLPRVRDAFNVISPKKEGTATKPLFLNMML